MSYVRLNLSDGQVFNASHVSHIEDGIEDCETQLSEVNQSLTDFSAYQFPTDTSVLTTAESLPNGWTFGYINSSGVSTDITDLPNNYNYVLAVGKYNNNNIVVIAIRFSASSSFFYIREKITGTWTDSWTVVS